MDLGQLNMATSAIIIALISTLQFKAAISAAINYEPIKIIVNENFNAQAGQASTEFESLEPGVIHQGANFYFKPKFSLPSSSISHHIEALMSLIQQHHSCAKDSTKVVLKKETLMEVLMPFLFSKETLSDIVLKEENNSEIVNAEPILITQEPKLAIPDLEMPLLSFNGIPNIVEEEVINEESVILEEPKSALNEVRPKPATPELPILPVPMLPPLSTNNIHIVEEVKVEEPTALPMPESIVFDIKPKTEASELLIIPEAPKLQPLSFDGFPATVKEEVKKEESVLLEKSTSLFSEPAIIEVEPQLLVIPEAPNLPPLSLDEIPQLIEEESKILKESQEPTIIEIESKPRTPEFQMIPEAPALSPLSVNDIRFVEDVKLQEPITLPLPDSMVVDMKPKTMAPELLVIPEAPMLSPFSFNGFPATVKEEVKKEESILFEKSTGLFSEPAIIEVEPQLLIIPEAPNLPPLSLDDIPQLIEKELKKEESKTLEGSQDPTIIEIESKPATPDFQMIPEAPVLPPLSANDIRFVEEMKIQEPITLPMPESIVVDIEPKTVTSRLLVIPEAPKLQPLSFDGFPATVKEEVKKEESVLLEKSTGLFSEPAIIEIEPQLLVVPEAPNLPQLSLDDIPQLIEYELRKEKSKILEESQEPTIIEIKSKPASPEFQVIPDAPVLPPLSENDIRIDEEVKIQEPITLPMPESIVVDIESKTVTSGLLVIPEAPKLQSLSFDGFPATVKEEVKKEESVLLEKSTGLFSEPAIIEVEPKLLVIPEASNLQPLSLDEIPQLIEKELKKEKSKILEESQDPTIIEIESKPATPDFQMIPEAPVLPPLSANDIRFVEEVKIQEPISLPKPESIVVDIESKTVTSGLLVIPEAPKLQSLSFDGFPATVKEEVKKEESVLLEKSTGLFSEPAIIEVEPKLLVIPEAPNLQPLSLDEIPQLIEKELKKEKSKILEESQDPTIIEIESKPATPDFQMIPEAPVLPPLSANDIRFVEEVKIQEPISLPKPESIVIDFKPKTVAPELLVIPEAPKLQPLSFDGFPATVKEDVKKEESVLLEKSTGLFLEPAIIEVKPKLVVIPEAPNLPPLSLDEIPQLIEKELKKEKSKILEESQDPTIIEIESKPTTPDFQMIPEAPVLPPLSANDIRFVEEVKIQEPISLPKPESIVIDFKPQAPELLVIPEAPKLQPLSFDGFPATVKEDVKKEKSVLLEKTTGFFSEPAFIEVEPQLLVIPKAPNLPPLSLDDIPQLIEKELKKEESKILEELQESTIIEIESKPEFQMIPKAPVLPPLSAVEEVKIQEPITLPIPESMFVDIFEEKNKKEESLLLEKSQEPIIIEIEPKFATPKFQVIPEAPVLPPLSYNGIPATVREEIKKEELMSL